MTQLELKDIKDGIDILVRLAKTVRAITTGNAARKATAKAEKSLAALRDAVHSALTDLLFLEPDYEKVQKVIGDAQAVGLDIEVASLKERLKLHADAPQKGPVSRLRPTVKKTAARRPAARKLAVKKTATKRAAAKKSSAKRSTAKKSAAKRSAVRKSMAKKSAAKRSTAKRVAR